MKFLIIQTAFLGDVVLATPLIEKLREFYPDSTIDMMVRKGNESLLANNPHLGKVLVFNKKQGKYRNLYRMIKTVRKERYDYVINVQRFFTTGLITWLSGGKTTIGFQKNPLSFTFSKALPHKITKDGTQHEVERNLSLIQSLTDDQLVKPKLYPSVADFNKVKTDQPYVCIAPASVWFTKQWPPNKWVDLIRQMPRDMEVYLLGAKSDQILCEQIKEEAGGDRIKIVAGTLSLLESAALMKGARMNYTNDSAPTHLASAMNAPVTTVFCSTVPQFGFYPLSDISVVEETSEPLDCRPCGLHGYRECPEGHFKCAQIKVDPLINSIDQAPN